MRALAPVTVSDAPSVRGGLERESRCDFPDIHAEESPQGRVAPRPRRDGLRPVWAGFRLASDF